MDRLLTIRVGDEPRSNETVVVPLSAMKKHLLQADRDRYVAAWNERAAAKCRARESNGTPGIPPDAHDRQLHFARWVFEFCTKREPTPDWIEARWQDRKRRGIVKRAA